MQSLFLYPDDGGISFQHSAKKKLKNLLTKGQVVGIMYIKDIHNIHEVHNGYYHFKFF